MERRMNLRHYGLVLFALLAGCTYPYTASKQHRLFSSIRDAVVHVGHFKQYGQREIGELLGTGFFVDQNCRVATAKHLLENANKKGIYIKYIPPEDRNRFETLIVELIYEDENKDLAFLKPKNCYSKTIKPLPLTRKLDGLSSLGGETVFVGGFPRLGAQSMDFPILRKSIIASTEFTDVQKGGPVLLLDLIGARGFSGSPVVLERTGEVIGVVRGSIKTAAAEHYYAFEGATPVTQADYDAALGKQHLESK